MTRRPLVVVTRSSADVEYLASAIRRLGADVEEAPAIQIHPATGIRLVSGRLGSPSSYDWAVFTSANGVRTIWPDDGPINVDQGLRFAVVGPATGRELRRRGIAVSFMPTEYTTTALAQQFPDPAGQRLVLLRAQKSNPQLPKILQERGALVDDVPVYTTMPAPTLSEIADKWSNHPPDWIVFASPSAAEAFDATFSPEHPIRSQTQTACIGPVTAQAARSLGFNVRVSANPHTVDGLVESLREVLHAK